MTAVLFVVGGLAVVIYGVNSYRQLTRDMSENLASIPWWLAAVLAGMIELGAILILVMFLLA